MPESKAFFTYAVGEKYLQLSYSLARSYKHHNGLTVPFYIVSCQDFSLPRDLQSWVRKKIVPAELVGRGLEFKLQLLELAPAYQSIFIDSDSLIYGNISFLFDKFINSNVNVIGTMVNAGTWVDEDIESLMKEFDIPAVIRYCGAFYYLKKSNKAREIFAEANKIYGKRKFQSHSSYMNEEPILSLAMSQHGVEPVIDNGNIWGDLVHFNSKTKLNVLNSNSVKFNNSLGKKHKFWIPTGEYRPLILHVGSGIYNKNPWVFDAARLQLSSKFGLNKTAIEIIVNTIIKPNYFLKRAISKLTTKFSLL